MELHEIKNLLHNNEIVTRLKRPPTKCQKIFTSDKGLITRIYRELKN
jgi:hypothetical protein